MKIKCSNPECDGKDSPSFNVTIVVDEDKEVAENIKKIDAEYFECCHCGSDAEDVTT